MDQEHDAIPAAKKLKIAAAAEKRLLRNEAAAEKTVDKAKMRLAKAEAALNDVRARFERRAKDLFDAEAMLRTRQQERAAGPSHHEGNSDDATPDIPQV